jgi:pantetheine-phosphate adenylyltransferase
MNKQNVKAICPGSFDPVTNGHIDIIERTAQMFPSVVVGVVENPSKRPLFSLEERVDLLKLVLGHLPNVEVFCFRGLLVDFVHQMNGSVIVKGLRAISDFEIEFQMALINKRMTPEIETMFMMTKNEYSFLSSSIVKELAQLSGDIHGLVPERVEKALLEKYKTIAGATKCQK